MKKKLYLFCLAVLLLAGVLSACGGGEGMTMECSALSEEPTFWDFEVDGTAMQLIAIRDTDDTVRLAFNTCQSCNGSPYAYFEYIGDGTLQCQNCGLTFSTDTVGVTNSKGCNPVSVSNFDVKDDMVTIPGSVLSKGVKLFSNWKVFD